MKKFIKRFFNTAHELYSWQTSLERISKQHFYDYLEQCRIHIATDELRSKTNRNVIEAVRYILKTDQNIREQVAQDLQSGRF